MDKTGTGAIARRQLIVCCDGTNNNLTGRRQDTNVSQLCELLAPEQNRQLLYYDPGVGNAGSLPEATWGEKIQQKYERLSGLAFGSGIYENIAEAYYFLMRNWQEGDDIFLFGFSRGAFTARSLGGLVTQFGILRPGMEVMVPTLLYSYFRERGTAARKAEFDRTRDQISQLFASDAAREAHVWFVGVWDTVASVGAPLPFLKKEITANPTIVGKRFDNVRQALALDEYRTTFKPRPYLIQEGYDYARHQQTIDQAWFDGGHCDVGGGYENDHAGLSQQSFLWMVKEAASDVGRLRLRSELLGADGLPDTTRIGQFLDALSEQRGPREKLVQSEVYRTAWWAMGGMSVRNPSDILDDGRAPQVAPRESPTVAANNLKFPADSEWRRPRPWWPLMLAALFCLVFWTIAGAFLLGPDKPGSGTFLQVLLQFFPALPLLWDANVGFAQWQIGWPFAWQSMNAWEDFHSPVKAVLADFFLIASYGYLLARGMGWAFSRRAGLRRVGDPVPKWLNRLGQSGPLAMCGDLAENVLTLLVIGTSPNDFTPALPFALGVLMSLAALAKWVGILGCLLLITWGLLGGSARRKTPR